MRSRYLTLLLLSFGPILGFNYANNACKDLNNYPTRALRSDCYYDPDVWAEFGEIVEHHGYQYETHEVLNADGFYLTVFRILSNVSNSQSQPILFIHGTSANALCWLVGGKSSLPFRLADMGHDVWVGNLRATQYSKRHIKYQSNQKEYWQYNLDSLASDDIPTHLRLVKEKTGKKIIYIGHSLGTTLGFMFASEYPSESEKLVKGIIALCPAVYFENANRAIQKSLKADEIYNTTSSINIWSTPSSLRFRWMTYTYCGFYPFKCIESVEKDMGPFAQPFKSEILLNMLSKASDAVSLNQLLQYTQMMKSNSFHKFNYDPESNLKVYDQEKPPIYNLTKILLPVVLFNGESDILATEQNAMRVYNELGSREKVLRKIPKGKPEIKFNHLDFLLAYNLEEYLYRDVFEIINKWRTYV